MNWLNKFEKKFGRFAIPNLMLYVTILYVIGIILNIADSSFYFRYLSLNMDAIFHGQVWRLITFIIYPPSSSVIFAAIMAYMFFSIGSTLEHIWGSFRFTLYFVLGIVFHILGALIIYLVFKQNVIVTTSYLNWSLFFAFAATFPDVQFLLFYLIPVKAKVLGIIDGVIFALSFVMAVIGRDWASALMIVMSLLNFFVFILVTRKSGWSSVKVVKQRVKFRNEMQSVQAKAKQTRHKCAVCGQTELDNPELEFRYCSKCSGGREYCMEHLYTHVHVSDN